MGYYSTMVGMSINLKGGLAVSLILCLSPGILGLKCIKGVNKFAASKGRDYFYECSNPGEIPILNQCPAGQIYDRKLEKCQQRNLKKEGGDANMDIRFEPALGRQFRLGDFYDARRDLPLNGYSFWHEDVITENSQMDHKYYSNTRFFAENTENDRIAHFQIDASLKLSFLGGLIDVDGSAHYLRDQKETEKHIRFNMEYDATTKTQSMPMRLRNNKTYVHICGEIGSDNGPTHVVTSVEDGMKAVFVYERYVYEYEYTEEISGSLQVAIKSIPGLTIQGGADLDMNGVDREFSESLEVTLFGDFILDKSPTTYNDSVKVFNELPKYLGTKESDYEDSSIMMVMLTPVDQFCSETDIVLTAISDGLMSQATEALEDLNIVSLKIRTLMNSYLADKFMDIYTILKMFDTKLQVYILEFKHELGTILPEMRGGGGEEKLNELLVEYVESPFERGTAYEFLLEREREMNTINHLFSEVQAEQREDNPSIFIGDPATANIAKALLKKTFVIIYKFSVFTDIEVTEQFLANKTLDTDTWYNDYTRIGQAGFEWRGFSKFAQANRPTNETAEDNDAAFFILGSKIGDRLSQIDIYKNGILVTNNFTVPDEPPKPVLIDITSDSATILLGDTRHVKNEFVLGVRLKYSCLTYMLEELKEEFVDVLFGTDTTEVMVTIELPILGTCEAESSYLTDFGEGASSELLMDIETLASGKPDIHPDYPQYPDCTSAVLSWTEPETDVGVVLKYEVEIRPLSSSAEKPTNMFSTNENTWTFTGLRASHKYLATIVPIIGADFAFDELNTTHHEGAELRGDFVTRELVTIPEIPTQPEQIALSDHDITLQLIELDSVNLPEEGDFRGFQVQYSKVNYETFETLPGSLSLAVFQTSLVNISGLASGTEYNFTYKILSHSGDSHLSNPLFAQTSMNGSAIEDMRKEMMESYINKATADLNETIEASRAEFVHSELSKLREVSLHGGDSRSGTLYVDGYPVCHSGWDHKDSAIACKTLGFRGYKNDRTVAMDDTESSMSNVQCTGSETSLFECQHVMFGGCSAKEGVELECSDCPDGWLAYEKHCYKHFDEAKLFEEAVDVCAGNNGHLASIHSLEENNLISTNLVSSFWIGGFTYADSYSWKDGSDMDFTNWAEKQPGDIDHKCMTITMESGAWADGKCQDEQLPF